MSCCAILRGKYRSTHTTTNHSHFTQPPGNHWHITHLLWFATIFSNSKLTNIFLQFVFYISVFYYSPHSSFSNFFYNYCSFLLEFFLLMPRQLPILLTHKLAQKQKCKFLCHLAISAGCQIKWMNFDCLGGLWAGRRLVERQTIMESGNKICINIGKSEKESTEIKMKFVYV